MENRISNRIKKRLIMLLVVALALGNFIPMQATTSYAKGTRVFKQTFRLELNEDRDDSFDSPYLSKRTLYIKSLNGDKFSSSIEWDNNYQVICYISKKGKGCTLRLEQDSITKRAKTKLVLVTKKKRLKYIITLYLDHYDSNGNIIRSDGTFEKKGSWDSKINRSDDDTTTPTPRPVPSYAPDDEIKVPDNTDPIQIQRIKKEAAEYGTIIDSTRFFSDSDIYSWDWAKPKTTAEQKAFDAIVAEIRSLCADPDATLKNRSWVNTKKSGIKLRSGQLVQNNDTDLLTLPLYAPSWMSEQRKREIIINLYFLDRTTYGPGPDISMEDEDYPYQRILAGTYQGVCGRGAMRAFRILYCTNLGFVPHVICDYDANHAWLTVDSIDRDGTKFMRGIGITANTFDMAFSSPLNKDRGWYESYTTTGYKKLKSAYYYVPKGVSQTYEELGHPWKYYTKLYDDVRYYDYWSGLIDILAVNDMMNF